ncbi:hypothetical protein YC2023_066006 [Brassica napus]
MTSVGVRQHTQDVHGCPSAHIRRQWLSISTHISTLVLGLSTLALPVDCFGDFGPRGLSVQYTQDVHGCPPAHTGRLWLSVAVRQHTQDVCGCPSVSMCVRVCPSAHTGRLWLSISTHISTLVLGLSTVALHVDYSGDFSPRGLSVQYTHDVRRCPSAHTGHPYVSVSKTQDVRCCSCVSVCVRQHTQDVCGLHTGCPWVSASTHRTYVAVRGCSSAHTGRPWVSVCVHLCLCLSVSTQRTSVAVHQYTYQHAGPWTQHAGPSRGLFGTHISTLVLGLSTLTPPVDCSGDFGLRGLSVQYTQDVRGCPPAHTGGLWLSVSTHRTSVAVRVCVRVCPSAHTGRPWLSISTHIRTLALGLSTLTLPVDCSGDLGPRWLSVQYTQDVHGCPPAHTGRPWLFVAVCQHSQDVRGCPCVSVCVRQHTQDVLHTGRPWVFVSTHRTSVGVGQHTQDVCGGHPWLSISTYISTLVLGLSMLALPVDCSGDFGPRGLSVQYTQDVRQHTQDIRQHTQDIRVCPSAHTGRLWLSVCVRVCPSAHTGRPWAVCSVHTGRPWVSTSTHRTPVAVRVCLSVSVSTHRTSAAAHQYTYQHVVHTGCPWVSANTQRTYVAVRGCSSAHTGRPWLSMCVRVCLWVSASTHMTSVAVRQHTQDVRVCPSAHTGRPYVSLCLCVFVSTQRTSMAVHQYTYHHAGPWTRHSGPSRGLIGVFWPTWAVCSVHTGRLWVSASTHRMSVAVRQHTQNVCGCPCVSVCVHVCPSAHTGRPWLSISTYISTLALPVDCSGDFGPRGLSVQYTQDVRGCPSAHTGHPCVSVSTHRTSVAVHVCLSAHTGRPWQSISTHISTLVLGLSPVTLPVDCSGDFGPGGLSVQYTQDVRGCPLVHTGRLWLSVCVFLCLSAHTGRRWLSISTHISTLVLGLSTLALPVDCFGDFGPLGLSVQYTQDVCGCPPAHTERLWLSVAVRQHTQDIRGCPCVSVSTYMTSVGVRQHTHDVCVCPSEHVGRMWLFVCVRQHTQDVRVCPTQDVRGCPSVHISARWSFGLSTLALPVDCLGDFGPRGGVCSVHTGRLWVSASTHRMSVAVRQHTQDVCGCPCVSVCVHVCPSAHTGRPWLSISTYISTLALPVDCSGDFGPRGLSVQYTQDVRGCPSAHTGHPCVSVSTHRTSVAVHVCLSAHTGRPWQSISTHISTLVLGLSPVTLPVDCSGDFGPGGLSVQYTQDVRGCPPVHTGRLWLSVCVFLCLSAHTGRRWLSISTHISTLVLGLSTLALPVDCFGDFGPLGLSVQYTQDVCGCPPAHTERLWLSVAVRQHTQDIRGCPCVSVSTYMTSVGVRQHTHDVCVCPSAHVGRMWLFVCVRQHTQDVRVCPTQDVRGCPSVHISARWSFGLSTLALPVDCLGDFGPRGGVCSVHTGRPWVSASTHRMSVAVCGCPSTHTGRPWLSVCVHVCPCLSVSTHRTSVAVHQYTYQHVGPWTQHAGPSRGLFG